jgi:hypothetical protein
MVAAAKAAVAVRRDEREDVYVRPLDRLADDLRRNGSQLP